MSPEDRELTECAARAAGKEVLGWIGDEIHTRDHADATPDIGQFDPLNNDGDALRLAMKFGFIIDAPARSGEEARVQFFDIHVREPVRGCRFSATRRAIVTAAAAIWLSHLAEVDESKFGLTVTGE